MKAKWMLVACPKEIIPAKSETVCPGHIDIFKTDVARFDAEIIPAGIDTFREIWRLNEFDAFQKIIPAYLYV